MDEAARAKAQFCLALDIAPSEYDKLTAREVQAFIKVGKKLKKLK